jgi:hypothetical protein
VIYFLIGVITGLILVFAAGYFTGRGARVDRQLALADLQTALDRCHRPEWTPTAPQPVWPEDDFSSISAGWERLERQQRGWGW